MLELCESKLAELRLVGLEQVWVAAIGHWGSVIMIPQYDFLCEFEHDEVRLPNESAKASGQR